MRLPRFMPCVALACTLSVPLIGAHAIFAQDASAVPAASSQPQVQLPDNEKLTDSIENYWHYGMIARYDIASAEGQRILDQNPDPQTLLTDFENVADAHHVSLDQWMLRWEGVDAMKAVTTQLLNGLSKGRSARRADPKYIDANIKLAAENARGFQLALPRLRESGELAVPIMIDDLRNPQMVDDHVAIRAALRGMGLSAVNPLLAATEMKDPETLMAVVSALGDIGYDVAVPYIARLLQNADTPGQVKEAAKVALLHLRVGDPDHVSATDAFFNLAEKFYYNESAVRADNRSPVAHVWFWAEDKGLYYKDVDAVIFSQVMAMRAAEYSLQLGQAQGDAISLWLSADYLREANLPAGSTDPTHPNTLPANFYGVNSGVRYLNAAINRANRDGNSAVALRAVMSLADIAGDSALFEQNQAQPLIDATRFPDRLVRYEAAFALAAALPQKAFAGEERVVPLLAEAVSQTGTGTLLIVHPNQDTLNKMMDGLKGVGYNVIGATTPEAAVADAAQRSSIDAVVICDELGQQEIDHLLTLAASTPRLERSARVIITKTDASPFVLEALNDRMLTVTQATDAASLKVAIDQARKQSGTLPLDEATATSYAQRAAHMLATLAVNRTPVFDLTQAQTQLLASLEDARPEIVKSVAITLSLLSGKDIQTALNSKAVDDKTSDDLKIALFKALAVNAKNFGDMLDRDQVDAMQKVVDTAASPDVRTAAGQARGALNLPSDQAEKLIMEQVTH